MIMLESFSSVATLVLMIPVIVLTLYVYKKTMLIRFVGDQQVQIINQISVGSKERLLLLKINEEVILVGVTPHKISRLHVVNNGSSFT